ncbi:MAG: putative toxin-antitoxin system toxin component, PIN family [Phycisphaerae bacterium]|nr:putative toxin-antitoxin system toxin component, PIN family [Saprospiraceae bacterium]
MPRTPARIAIDTNLWVSHVFNQFKSHLNVILEDEDVEIITSPELTHEIFEVLSRTKFQSKIPVSVIATFQELYDQSTLSVEIVTVVSDCRDPKDNHLLSLTIDGDLDYLLTGDADLLILDPYGKTRVLKIADYVTKE